MNPIPTRIVVYPKDVMNITGRRQRASRKLLDRIRIQNGKDPEAFVTLEEFCRFTGMKEEYVRPFLK